MSKGTKWGIAGTTFAVLVLIGVIIFALTRGTERPEVTIEKLANRVDSQIGGFLHIPHSNSDTRQGSGVYFDVKKTDSVVSPYSASISFETWEERPHTRHRWHATYAFQQAKWVLKEITGERYLSGPAPRKSLEKMQYYPEFNYADGYLYWNGKKTHVQIKDYLIKMFTP